MILVPVIDHPVEDFVFAVFRPRLGDCLDLHISDPAIQPMGLALRFHAGVSQIRLNGLHLTEIEGKKSLAAYF